MSSDNLRTANWLGYSSSAVYTFYKTLSNVLTYLLHGAESFLRS